MATATKKSPSPSPQPLDSPSVPASRVLRLFDAVYRFLASLKLAVISLGTLAAVLAYATFFESWYGTSAVQEWIYQTKAFAILLAFLGVNILCAALIRFPWKPRQTGFVITHAGLLVLLAGSFWSLKTSDEGQLGMVEGQTRDELVRIDYPVIRVWPMDPQTHKPTNEEFRLPFRPGNFAWGPGQPRPRGFFGTIAHTLTAGLFDSSRGEGEVLTGPSDPIKFVVKSHLPASVLSTAHVADPSGIPMVKIRVQATMPGQARPLEAFEDEMEQERWLTPHQEDLIPVFRKLYRVVKKKGPASFAFLYADRPELIDDFVNPPKDSGPAGVVRMRYRDKAGKPRLYEWRLDDAVEAKKPADADHDHTHDDSTHANAHAHAHEDAAKKSSDEFLGKTVTLPDSDITATFKGVAEIPAGLDRLLGESEIPVAHFKVRKGDGPEADYYGWALLPMVPSQVPSARGPAEPLGDPAVQLTYFLPPTLDAASGRLGLIEILGTPDGTLYHRVFGRGKQGVAEFRSVGPLARGKEVVAFGGVPNMPMTLTFRVDEYLTAGREEEICEPVVLPKGQSGLAASLVAMTVKDGDRSTTKEFWIRRSPTLDPAPQHVEFPSGEYEVVYDVDRRPVGFSLKLDDFEVGFDPGTQQPSSFVSKVRLTDESMGIKDKPYTISMNEPLTHRGYTFYQSNYSREVDPRTLRETGRFQSVFQVGLDPGRRIKYLGCVLVVFGAFVQFYMRAGLFSDGGKRERARAEARVRKRAGTTNGTPDPVRSDVEVVTESEETL